MYPGYINWHLEIILIRKPKCQLVYPGYIKQHFMVVFFCALMQSLSSQKEQKLSVLLGSTPIAHFNCFVHSEECN